MLPAAQREISIWETGMAGAAAGSRLGIVRRPLGSDGANESMENHQLSAPERAISGGCFPISSASHHRVL